MLVLVALAVGWFTGELRYPSNRITLVVSRSFQPLAFYLLSAAYLAVAALFARWFWHVRRRP